HRPRTPEPWNPDGPGASYLESDGMRPAGRPDPPWGRAERTMNRTGTRRSAGFGAGIGVAAAVLRLAGAAAAQPCGTPDPTPAASAAPAPVDQRTLQEMQRDLRKLRATYFGSMRNREIRQVGISKLREYTDPIIFPELLELFAYEQE